MPTPLERRAGRQILAAAIVGALLLVTKAVGWIG